MELNREQIIKALELCTTEEDCVGCPYLIRRGDGSILPCTIDADALSLINELTEEREDFEIRALRAENEAAKYKDRYETAKQAHEMLSESYNHLEKTKADTVRKMQERLKANRVRRNGLLFKVVDFEAIDRVAAEMLGGE